MEMQWEGRADPESELRPDGSAPIIYSELHTKHDRSYMATLQPPRVEGWKVEATKPARDSPLWLRF